MSSRTLFFALLTSLAAAFSLPVLARPGLDCPLRDQTYSIDTPLIDVLLKPEAKAAAQRDAPDLLSRLPPMMTSTTPPTFASIVSLRMMAALTHVPDPSLLALNNDLATLPITSADRQARCARYDDERPKLNIPTGHPRLLLFEKMTGYRDSPSVEAADAALSAMAQRNGWSLFTTDKGGAIAASVLKQFDAVIWNNVSGDVLTLSQRAALQRYVEHGGGFVAFHGSGGDPVYYWDWYADTLIGARFIGHPLAPQFQEARIVIEGNPTSIGRDLAPGWRMTDEWYSFKSSPRESGAHIVATLDETSYSPKGMGSQDLHMGDHPIAWAKCVGRGRSFYTAIGHRPESYSEVHTVKLLENAVIWASGASPDDLGCKANKSP